MLEGQEHSSGAFVSALAAIAASVSVSQTVAARVLSPAGLAVADAVADVVADAAVPAVSPWFSLAVHERAPRPPTLLVRLRAGRENRIVSHRQGWGRRTCLRLEPVSAPSSASWPMTLFLACVVCCWVNTESSSLLARMRRAVCIEAYESKRSEWAAMGEYVYHLVAVDDNFGQ